MRHLLNTVTVALFFALLTPVRAFAQTAAPVQGGAPSPSVSPKRLPPIQPGPSAVAELLTDEERASLESRAEQPGPEVTGGALSNEHLTYIVIALAAAVLVLVLK